MIPSDQELQKHYAAAPDLVKEFITSVELSTAFQEIRTHHQLHLDEAGALSRALNSVFLELNDYQKFPSLLKEALEQNSGQYDAVLKEVNEKIFTAFRKKLEEPEEVEEPTNVAQPVTSTQNPTTPNLAELEKTVAFNEPVALPTNNDSITENKLKETTQEKPTDVEIKTPSTTDEATSKPYAADPYREPIE